MHNIAIKAKIKKWEKSFIRDRWGNLINCYWNQMAKEEILKLESILKNLNNELVLKEKTTINNFD